MVTVATMRCPCLVSVAPFSRLSRTLRAACGGGLRRSLTGTALGALDCYGQGEETAFQPNKETGFGERLADFVGEYGRGFVSEWSGLAAL
jgi:hypothetical protein